jgi:hypothetical protein
MAKLLANKIVVITGSSQGIGRATAIGKLSFRKSPGVSLRIDMKDLDLVSACTTWVRKPNAMS